MLAEGGWKRDSASEGLGPLRSAALSIHLYVLSVASGPLKHHTLLTTIILCTEKCVDHARNEREGRRRSEEEPALIGTSYQSKF